MTSFPSILPVSLGLVLGAAVCSWRPLRQRPSRRGVALTRGPVGSPGGSGEMPSSTVKLCRGKPLPPSVPRSFSALMRVGNSSL
ncbi:hypothetical protein LZ30DRAFT_704126 [Colletotrichum cereale]|nr:hypothetical protein LZ30DRAFT_704126 [Colletotrichum cereale]